MKQFFKPQHQKIDTKGNFNCCWMKNFTILPSFPNSIMPSLCTSAGLDIPSMGTSVPGGSGPWYNMAP